MNRQYCIFKADKNCNNCGECERCDLNPGKICNNCGKCLEMEGYDMRAIKVDGIIEDKDEAIEYEKELDGKGYGFNNDNDYQLINEKDTGYEVSDENIEIFDDYIDGYAYKKENFDDIEKNMEFIDDIDGLRELLEDENKVSQMIVEEFPGLYRLKR